MWWPEALCRGEGRSRRGRALVAALLLLPPLGALACLAPASVLASTTQTATITAPGETAYPIPTGTYSLQVTVVGSAGAHVGGDASPGDGAQVETSIRAPDGVSTLYVEVGNATGQGGGGYSAYAAAGGGESDIQTCSVSAPGCTDTAAPSSDPRLVVAGGGGGGGADAYGHTGGAGGSAGSAGTAMTGPGAGGAGDTFTTEAPFPGSGAGLGDSPASAGPVVTADGQSGDGAPGTGGAGEADLPGYASGGGGGGGGWVGGSGGGDGGYWASAYSFSIAAGGGGGAGASFVEATATGTTVGDAVGTPPEVIITADIGTAAAIGSAASTTFTAGSAGSFTITATGDPTPSLDDGGAALPAGVTFTDNGDGTATLSGTPGAGTAATWSLTVTASNGVNPAASQDFTLTVAGAATTTTVSSSPAPSIEGQPVTITVTVKPVAAGLGNPTGTVDVDVDGSLLQAVTLDSTVDSRAIVTTTGITTGTHSITATYGGDSTYAGSESAPSGDTQAVTAAVTVPDTGARPPSGPPIWPGLLLAVTGVAVLGWRRLSDPGSAPSGS